MKNNRYQFLLLACLILLVSSKSEYRVTKAQKGSSIITLSLEYTGKDDYYGNQKSPILKNLTFTLRILAFHDFAFKITDPNNSRFQIPQQGIFPIDPLRNFSFPLNLSGMRFEYTESPFDFRISRKINNGTLFSTYETNFVFSDKYIEIGTELDSDYIWGLGERFTTDFRKKVGKWTIFNRDRGQVMDEGTGLQTYGYYPFYLQRENQKFYHINYFRTSNALDAIREQKNGKNFLTFKVIGGIIDFRFFLNEQSPEITLQKFQLYLGRSTIPPFWAFGFHQCRWGYNNITYLQNVLDSFKKNDLPLDTIWSDIDYMLDYEDFTIDESRFPLDKMRQITNNYHYIPIIDAGIKVNNGTAYTEGKSRGVFIQDANGQQLRGKVWPGTTTFVDFFHPNASKYWSDMLDILYKKVQFSGIWLDMNEYANFCDGPCDTPTGESTFDYSKDLPYTPGSDSIQAHTIPLNSTHYGKKSEADVHAFAAFMQNSATNQFLKNKGKRPFIISRSSSFGSNKFGFHWTGDNYASFQFLKASIPDIFNNQMWGFQMVGPDICGFGGNTTQELCARWYQLAALYPFARSHNDHDSIDQEPYALGENVLKAAKTSLNLRYSLLKYYYSIFVIKRGLGTIFKPLFFNFPLDNNNYVDEIANTQFLIGPNLMSAPILQEGKTSRNVYFTSENWYDFYTGQLFKPGTSLVRDVLMTDPVPLFIHEGGAIFTQNSENVRSTKDLDNTFQLVAGFRFEKQRSNDTYQFYSAVSNMLSIRDYSDETKLEFCLFEGCEYAFNLLLTVTQNTRSLKITTSYGGGILLNELMIIDQVTVYYDGIAVTNDLVNPIQIKGPNDITIPINNPDRKNLKVE